MNTTLEKTRTIKIGKYELTVPTKEGKTITIEINKIPDLKCPKQNEEVLRKCGMSQKVSNPELSRAMKDVGFKNLCLQKPLPFKHEASEYLLDDINIGSCLISAYTKDNAKDDYVNIPSTNKWMMVPPPKGTDINTPLIPAAWVYWIGSENSSHPDKQQVKQPKNHILEPINFIFIVKSVPNDDDAAVNAHLTNLLKNAGFSALESIFHTGGYATYFESEENVYHQTSFEINHKDTPVTFSNRSFVNGGVHFRLLGPYKTEDGTYIYTASISEESRFHFDKSDCRCGCGHMYISFTEAKNELAKCLLEPKDPKYKVNLYSTNLFNTIPVNTSGQYDPSEIFFTGDHQEDEEMQSSNVCFVAISNYE